MTHWDDAGFGTDPEGDARRRAELGSARYDPAALPVLADAARRTSHIAPPSPEEPVEGVLLMPDALLAAVDSSELDAQIEEQLARPVDPHTLTGVPYPWGVAWTCSCRRWEAAATGPSSASWAGRDHRRHVQDEEAGTRGE